MKVNIIVALYYPHYFEKVKKEIFAIFNKSNFQVLFVDNHGKMFNEHVPENGVQWLRGSNIAGEFSAWDEGYELLARSGTMEKNDIVLFMNDTFCHHRFFTFYDRILYRRAIARCNSDCMYGELNSTGTVFSINELPLTAWISSYVFLSRMGNIGKLLPLNSVSAISEADLAVIESGLAQHKVEIPIFSENLNQHLSHWLFPVSGNGWYRAGKTSSAILLFKLKAIVNEKLLTYKALKTNIVVKDIYQGKPSRIYNSLRNKLFILFKRHK